METTYEEESANKSPSMIINRTGETEQLDRELLQVAKQTLFYMQYPRTCPIIPPQQPCPTREKVIIHCVRHAQAYHNLRENPDRRITTDPKLTQLGVKQALNLKATFTTTNVTHILCSPLTRALQTAQIAFEDVISQGLKVVAYPDLREHGSGPASTGTSLQELQRLLHNANQITDLSLVPEGWESNDKECKDERRIRARRVRKELWELGQEALKETGGKWKGYEVSRGAMHQNIEILVVSHGAFLQKMLGLKRMFWNCEWKSFEFAREDNQSGINKYYLKETGESRSRVSTPIRE
ncbi:histidine phosphatase superfamily [Hyaloscypha sp. PMI_1271]|nr:histidine phosphatase superfamily [Hyaloscypha sp. PMI_1271]